MKPLRHLLALLLAVTALASCAQPPAETESQRLERELSVQIGAATCTADSQCRTVPVGAKACGGPAGYRAWSTQGTDANRVIELADRQAQAQRRENQAGGLRSTCSVAVDPGASCIAGRCQLKAATQVR